MIEFNMSNRVAFVTGASRGIGRAIAMALSGAGFDVVAAATSIESHPPFGSAMPVNLDVTSADSVKDAFARAIKEKGRIDVLVNNAGITRDGLAVRMKPADWDAVLSVNLDGAFRCIQQVLPGMMRNRWGRIINITSVVGEAGAAGQSNYAASKAGLIGLTKSLAQEMGSRGITVNAIAPGYIETDMTAGLPEEVKAKILTQIPLARMGQPEDIAHAVKFLAGDDAAYITGHILSINGGMYM
jgi:3-oxoacyl-[acyl-carrier protein] reductase